MFSFLSDRWIRSAFGSVGWGRMADVTVTPSADVSSTTLAVGETIAVRLAENPTTGHRWTSEGGGDRLVEIDSTFEPPPSRDKAGAGGTRVFRFRAARAGRVTLVLRYARPWEGGPAASQRELRVEIQDSRSEGG
jgi:inhibitor of cysteine peptidase